MTAVPVVYAQILAGERWRHYGAWARYLPLPLLERLGHHLPAKQLWSELIACGDRQAELSVLAGPAAAALSAAGLPAEQTAMPVVYSHNLGGRGGRQHQFGGRALALALLRRVLPLLARELALWGDHLVLALAVAEWERSFWVAGVEPYARSITVFLHQREKGRSIGATGVAVRQSSYLSGKVDAHVLVVSPQCLEAVRGLAMRQGTIVVCTNGLPLPDFYGCWSVDLGMAERLGVPAVIWAERGDELPVLEAVIVAASLASGVSRWSGYPLRQIATMDQALAWSEWPVAYTLRGDDFQAAGGD